MSANIQDLSGQYFGDWFVINFHSRGLVTKFNCKCICGTLRPVRSGDLKKGKSKNCGCKNGFKHGLYKHPIYNAWKHMRDRCYNPKNKHYKDYGGRGIIITSSWLDFTGFAKDMLPSWGKGLSLDRIDNNGNYEKENCKWSTSLEQANNRRINRKLFYQGESYTVSSLAKVANIGYRGFLERLKRYNFDVEKAMAVNNANKNQIR